jgi:hypothetical protein
VWVTHDGGARWRRIALPGDLLAMAASARTVCAVVSRGAADELFCSALGRDAWARVGTITGSFGAALAVFANAAWFGPGTAGTGTYLWATADGVHWHRYRSSCPARESLWVGIAAASRWQVAFFAPRRKAPSTPSRRCCARSTAAGPSTSPGRPRSAASRIFGAAGADHRWARPRLSGCYGAIAMAMGSLPTLIALSAVLVAVRIGVTVPEL